MKKFLYTWLIITLFLSLTACSASPQDGRPDSPSGDRNTSDAAAPEAACKTYAIPVFGVEFDVPADFGGEADSTVVSEDEARLAVETDEKLIVATCSRTASLDKTAEIFKQAGIDSSVLYEDVKLF